MEEDFEEGQEQQGEQQTVEIAQKADSKNNLVIILLSIFIVLIVASVGVYFFYFNDSSLVEENDDALEAVSSRINVKRGYAVAKDGIVEITPGTIDVINNKGVVVDTIIADKSGSAEINASVSPNERFIFYTVTLGDGGEGTIYDTFDMKGHDIGFITAVKPSKWLENGKFERYIGGCVESGGECRAVQSVSANTPWIFEENVPNNSIYPDDAQTDISEQQQTEKIISIERFGGLCAYGGCWSRFDMYSDGRLEYSEGSGSLNKEGNASKSDIAKVVKLIEETDFEKIRENKFTGVCPTAYDGSKTITTFHTDHGIEKIDSCETSIPDPDLFREVYILMDSL